MKVVPAKLGLANFSAIHLRICSASAAEGSECESCADRPTDCAERNMLWAKVTIDSTDVGSIIGVSIITHSE